MAQKKQPNGIERDIDENLRKAYQRLTQQPIPERFLQLLEELRSTPPRSGMDE